MIGIALEVAALWEFYMRQREGAFGRSWAGFTKDLDCGVPAFTRTDLLRRAAAAVGVCLINQALPAPDGAYYDLTPAEASSGFSILGQIESPPAPAPPNYRYNTLEHYTPTPGEIQTLNPWQLPGPAPWLPPWFEPFTPPGTWEQAPMAPPLWWVRHRPATTPWGDWEIGPSAIPQPALEPWRPVVPYIRPPRPRRPRPRQPGVSPGPETPEAILERIAVRPGQALVTKTKTVIRPSNHRARKPGKRTKERKVVVSATKMLAGRLAGKVTEGLDALDSVYEALPEKLRARERMRRHGKDPRAAVKLRLLYDHWEEVDLRQAVVNLLANELEDWFYGQLGRQAQAGLNRAGWRKPTGIEHGGTTQGAKIPGTAQSPVGTAAEWAAEMLVPRF